MEENLNEMIEEVNFAESEEDAVFFAEEEPKTVTVKVPRLNVRQSPSLTSKVIAEVAKGTVLTMHSEIPINEWFRVVTPDGLEGFVVSSFVE